MSLGIAFALVCAASFALGYLTHVVIVWEQKRHERKGSPGPGDISYEDGEGDPM